MTGPEGFPEYEESLEKIEEGAKEQAGKFASVQEQLKQTNIALADMRLEQEKFMRLNDPEGEPGEPPKPSEETKSIEKRTAFRVFYTARDLYKFLIPFVLGGGALAFGLFWVIQNYAGIDLCTLF